MTWRDSQPWQWLIYDSNDPDDRTAVRAHGIQHTQLHASPVEVAEERMAHAAYRAWRRGNLAIIASLVCLVRRVGDTGWAAKVTGKTWVQRFTRGISF